MAGAPLRLIFAGTPEFAARHLEALLESKHQLAAVYSQPDRPAGRGRNLRASPVKALGVAAGLPVYQPVSLREPEVQRHMASLEADALVVVAYGLILPPIVLDIPARGCINVHASLLPRWRGAAPIQRAIEAGDGDTGVTIMQMDAGLDTGAVLAAASCPIGRHTAATLQDELARLGTDLLLEVLADLPRHQAAATPQPGEGATYAHKIDKSEGLLRFDRDALELERRVRAFDPFPGCHTFLGAQRVKIWEAWSLAGTTPGLPPGTIARADEQGIAVACGDGHLGITSLQLPGGRRLPAADILHARRDEFTPGRRFTPEPVDSPP